MDDEMTNCFQCGKALVADRSINAYCSIECVHKQARGEHKIMNENGESK